MPDFVSFYRWHLPDPIVFRSERARDDPADRRGGACRAGARRAASGSSARRASPATGWYDLGAAARSRAFAICERQDDYCATAFVYCRDAQAVPRLDLAAATADIARRAVRNAEPVRGGARDAHALMPLALRLVSWNAHGAPGAPRREERMARIAHAALEREPDVVLLQEVWRQSDAELLFAAFRPAGYASVEVPGGREWPVRTSGLLSFVRSAAGWRAEQIRFHEYAAEAPDWKVWEGDGIGDKGALGFTLAREGFELGIWNTHLQAAYEPGGYAEVRRLQLIELRDAVAAGPAPALLAGDLNTTPDEAALAALVALTDLTAPLRMRCACGTSVDEPPSREWLDYLFSKSADGWRIEAEVSLLRSEQPDTPYSDHQGLDALVRVTPPSLHAALAWLAAARLAAPITRRELLAFGLAAWLSALRRYAV